MLDLALIGSALLMGAAGSAHCVAMCAAPCAAVTGGHRPRALAFQGGRVMSYAAAGAVAASSVGLLWQWEQAAAWLRPVWLALHLAVLALGLWLLWRGEQPAWMQRRWGPGAPGAMATPGTAAVTGGGAQTTPLATLQRHRQALGRPVRAAAAGLAWVAWPCGLLQSALLVAALATGPGQGALVMAAFALASSPGLVAGPWLLRRLAARNSAERVEGPGAGLVTGASGLRWATRLSGLLLSAAALWALGHGLWLQIRAYCG
ncbi:hypothetical protein SAMN05216359_101309 [Roseateles sp. YR242]|uniref:sulfite exporter TauE/SafE family protein n=1 Tax=Roseateles sp. YR242 TaxID=1855305 RepID=UPI0008CDDEBF|nr:sulfite exporter TauE/SafE family protein [Roseateles sp. YR242]SEK29007.1 hypothetical protein SAMN05216359_101309 [Roseateles sp. YR242]